MPGSRDADEPREQHELLPGLVRSRVRPTRKADGHGEPVAEADPVARVLVDVPLAHLDRPFDYAVPGVDGRRRRNRASGSRFGSRAGTSTASWSSAWPPPTTRAR